MKAGIPITWFEVIDSTNTEAHKHIGEADILSVYAARFQTAGRGQRGNRWESAAGDNLTFSILMQPDGLEIPQIGAGRQFMISEIASLTVASYLDSIGISPKIKWPNDIYVGNRKICGMLIENTLDGDRIAASVIGIGMNLNQTEFPPSLVNPTSVMKLKGQKMNPVAALEDICAVFRKWLGELQKGKDSFIEDAYLSRLYNIDRLCEYRDLTTGELFHGTIKGISKGGMLRMEMPDMTIKEFSFKEISYII